MKNKTKDFWKIKNESLKNLIFFFTIIIISFIAIIASSISVGSVNTVWFYIFNPDMENIRETAIQLINASQSWNLVNEILRGVFIVVLIKLINRFFNKSKLRLSDLGLNFDKRQPVYFVLGIALMSLMFIGSLFCKENNIPVMFDATRAVENAYMIKKKDSRYLNSSIKEILHEMFSYGDGCTVSSKKDYLVNIGGFLGIRDDEEFYRKTLSMLRIYEGSRTNGGMSAGDIAMHAEGVREMTDYNYIKSRVEQTNYLGKKLVNSGIPIVEPIGTHAVFLDAKRFLPHIDQDNYPAQALASALFIESGIRAMERGNVSSGRNKTTGKNYRPALELVRLTIPRHAYTNAHMDIVADAITKLYSKRETIKGLEFVYEPENLRFFQGKFEKVEG